MPPLDGQCPKKTKLYKFFFGALLPEINQLPSLVIAPFERRFIPINMERALVSFMLKLANPNYPRTPNGIPLSLTLLSVEELADHIETIYLLLAEQHITLPLVNQGWETVIQNSAHRRDCA